MAWLVVDAATVIALLFVPLDTNAFHALWPLLMIAQLSWFMQVARAATRLKSETGSFPLKERVKAAPFAGALIAFAVIGLGSPTWLEAQVLGFTGVLLSITSKLWVNRSVIRPVGSPWQ